LVRGKPGQSAAILGKLERIEALRIQGSGRERRRGMRGRRNDGAIGKILLEFASQSSAELTEDDADIRIYGTSAERSVEIDAIVFGDRDDGNGILELGCFEGTRLFWIRYAIDIMREREFTANLARERVVTYDNDSRLQELASLTTRLSKSARNAAAPRDAMSSEIMSVSHFTEIRCA